MVSKKSADHGRKIGEPGSRTNNGIEFGEFVPIEKIILSLF